MLSVIWQVLLYYDGRKALAMALKNLCMARRGTLWSCQAGDEVVDYVTQYIDKLVSDGIVQHILEVISPYLFK